MATRVAVFSTKPHDERFLTEANERHGHELVFLEAGLGPGTAVLATGCGAVCAFVNDDVGADTVDRLAEVGVGLIALRSAGYNHVDLAAAERHGITVVRVPEYSPHAVAEHCLGLILSLNRKIHRAYNRVRESNFALAGLLGFDLHGKTVGVVGTGKIGTSFVEILSGFGVRTIASDPYPDERCLELGVEYLPVDELLAASHIVTLHCPLTPDTYHLIDRDRLAAMRDGVMLVNTSRGALIDTAAVIDALKTGKVGYLGLDVYEEESALFFEDLSEQVLLDDVFSRLLTFPNVLITGHQGFFTVEALQAIAATTLDSISAVERGEDPPTVVRS